jgi:hypothetical protein
VRQTSFPVKGEKSAEAALPDTLADAALMWGKGAIGRGETGSLSIQEYQMRQTDCS